MTLGFPFRRALGPFWGKTQIRVLEWMTWTSSSQPDYTRNANGQRTSSPLPTGKPQKPTSGFPSQTCHRHDPPALRPYLLKPGVGTMIPNADREGWWAEATGVHIGCTLESPGEMSTVPARLSPTRIKFQPQGGGKQRALACRAAQLIPMYSQVWGPVVDGAYQNCWVVFGSKMTSLPSKFMHHRATAPSWGFIFYRWWDRKINWEPLN